MKKTIMETLNSNLHNKIISHLSTKDLMALEETCRGFYYMILRGKYYKKIIRSKSSIYLDNICYSDLRIYAFYLQFDFESLDFLYWFKTNRDYSYNFKSLMMEARYSLRKFIK